MRRLILAWTSLLLLPTLVAADLDSDFAACRRKIIQIGSDPKIPADQYCLGLSYAFAVNHKKKYDDCMRANRPGCTDPGPPPH